MFSGREPFQLGEAMCVQRLQPLSHLRWNVHEVYILSGTRAGDLLCSV